MSREIANILLSRLTNGNPPPTPEQIRRYLADRQTLVGMEGKVDGDLPQVLLSEFFQERTIRLKAAVTTSRIKREWFNGHRPVISSRNNKGK